MDGALDGETILQLLIETRVQIGGNVLAGIACSTRDMEREIDRLAHSLYYIITRKYNPPKNSFMVWAV